MTRRRLCLLVAAALVLLGGCRSAGSRTNGSPPPQQIHARGYTAPRHFTDVAPPDRLLIPSIGVSSALDRLHRSPDGTIEVPHRWQVAGWFQEGPRPGEPGPAAILGHVDSVSGPAVFARLHELRPGAEIDVMSGADRRRFRVTGSEEVPKDRFPSQEVYLPTLEPVLRLITCGGSFDRSTGHYVDNVIVSAVLIEAR